MCHVAPTFSSAKRRICTTSVPNNAAIMPWYCGIGVGCPKFRPRVIGILPRLWRCDFSISWVSLRCCQCFVKVLSKFRWTFIELLSKFHWSFVQVLSKCGESFVEVLSKLCRSFVEVLSKCCRRFVEVLSKFCRSVVEVLSKFCRSFVEMLSMFCLFFGV